MARLKGKRQRFVEEYRLDCNGTAAAIRAGYSEKTANEQAARLLANVSVQRAIAAANAERSARMRLRQDQVVEELASIAFAPASDERDSPLKYANKLRALELLGKHMSMFRERVQLEDADGHAVGGVVLLSPVMEAVAPPEDAAPPESGDDD